MWAFVVAEIQARKQRVETDQFPPPEFSKTRFFVSYNKLEPFCLPLHGLP